MLDQQPTNIEMQNTDQPPQVEMQQTSINAPQQPQDMFKPIGTYNNELKMSMMQREKSIVLPSDSQKIPAPNAIEQT